MPPTRIFSSEQRALLMRFPAFIAHDDIVVHFKLNSREQRHIDKMRLASNRLGVALQIGALRFLGFFPDDLLSAPTDLIDFVAQKVDAPRRALHDYAQRAQTRTDHQRAILRLLGFCRPNAENMRALDDWLVEQAMEHDRPSVLFSSAARHLHAQKIVRPGIDRLSQAVATARDRANDKTYQLVEPMLSSGMRKRLDRLLLPDLNIGGMSRLRWLRGAAGVANTKTIKEELAKLEYLREIGANRLVLDGIGPNRRYLLAEFACAATPQTLQRAATRRRYPILLAFLQQTTSGIVDTLVDLYDEALSESQRKAKRRRDELNIHRIKAMREKVAMFRVIADVVLDHKVRNVRRTVYDRIPESELRLAAAVAVELSRSSGELFFDCLGRYYSSIRRYVPELLAAIRLAANRSRRDLLDAVEVLRTCNAEGSSALPQDVSLEFVPPKWRPVLETGETPTRRWFELCVLYELRDAVRAGDVWVLESHKHADPQSYLLSAGQWRNKRKEFCVEMRQPRSGRRRLVVLEREQRAALTRLDRALNNADAVRLEDGRAVVTPLAAEQIPEESTRLNKILRDSLPRVDLTDILVEVDRWTGFSKQFTHAGSSRVRPHRHTEHILGAIMAHACNTGITRMSHASGGTISSDELLWATRWFLRGETCKASNATLINFQHRQPLARQWGDGRLSSSDGQRFMARRGVAGARYLQRYFGHGRGVTFYTWTSNQWSHYGTKVVPSVIRDATYVLDAILDNRTDLTIDEHTVDTSGFTETVFALFDLLGMRFSPRIRDAGSQLLYWIGGNPKPSNQSASLLRRTINRRLIVDNWDEMLRAACSLKSGWVTASMFVSRLQAQPRKSALARALQEYGRLQKTLFILKWLENKDFRRRICRQLNVGESLHALRRFLFFGNEGRITHRSHEDQSIQAECLNLVTNAVLVWNTVYMNHIINQMVSSGNIDKGIDVSHVSPAMHEHINPFGRITFAFDLLPDSGRLRPLNTKLDKVGS